MSIPWLRLYTETLSDRKIKLISVELDLPKPLVIGVWVSILMLAGESPDRGRLISSRGNPWPEDFICDEIGIDNKTFSQIMTEFLAFDMIYVDDDGVFCITKWDERQFKSDNSYERVKKFRAKQAQQTDQTGGNVTGSSNDYTKRSVSINENETFQETDQIQIQNTDIYDEEESHAPEETKLKQIVDLYTQNITIAIAPITAQEMQQAEYFTLPVQWWEEAIKIAADNNARKWTYVKGVLDRSIEAGQSPCTLGPPKKGQSNGRRQPGSNQRTNQTGQGPPRSTLDDQPSVNPYTGETIPAPT